MLQHHLLVTLEVRFDFAKGGGFRLKVVLHVIAVVLLRVIGVGKFLAAQSIDLFQSSAVGFELLGDLADHLVDRIFLALEFEDVDSFVFAFHRGIRAIR